MKVPRWILAGVIFAGLWVFVSGAALRPISLLTTYLVGLVIGLPVAFVFRRLYEDESDLLAFVQALPFVVRYVVVFLKEIGLASVDVTYRVLAPGMPIEPQVILVPLRVETDLGITTIANSISLTPGTVTLDHDPEENTLYVHGIDGREPEDIVGPMRQWEDYALAVFDEPGSPSDPVPEITVHPPDYPPEPKTVFEDLDDSVQLDDHDDDTEDGSGEAGGGDGEEGADSQATEGDTEAGHTEESTDSQATEADTEAGHTGEGADRQAEGVDQHSDPEAHTTDEEEGENDGR